MESTTAGGKRVSLDFYTGPSAPPPHYISLRGTVHDGTKTTTATFKNQVEADLWAANLGVERWHVTQRTRAFPEACRIPIKFAEAPNDERLNELISAFASGTALNDLVNGIVIEIAGKEFQVSPGVLGFWLIGAAPEHPALQRLKRNRASA
jgi:hypothetical protein